MSENLGKASLDLDVDLRDFERQVKTAERAADELRRALEALAAAANLTERETRDVKIAAGQAAESRASASAIVAGVRGISDEARDAARHLDEVKLDQANAAETALAAGRIERNLKGVTGEANEARRALESVRLAGGRNGVGVGAFGSGYGRIGLLGTAVGAGVVTGPAAGPAALGAIAAIPVLAGTGVGALGALALAFQGVGKAIGGDKKAYDDLVPAQQRFVQQVRSLDGTLNQLKQTAAGAMFPGLTEALHSALSPQTLAAVTRAVEQFGTAIGQAGAQWGRYLGSAEFRESFGPLMQAGARNLGVMSDAAMHLFDALGVLGRAAIPLTNWITRSIDDGARLASSWLRAKEASGALGGALDEARTSMQLVGGLVASLVRAVGALGEALYPVSKVAVKDLTDGLNALVGIIRRNQDVIRDIVAGALHALVGAVQVAVDGLGTLRSALTHIVDDKASIVTAIVAIGAAITVSMGPQAAAITGVIAAIGLIKTNWEQFGQWFETFSAKVIQNSAIIQAFTHLPGSVGDWARQLAGGAQVTLQTAAANAAGKHVPLDSPLNPTRNFATGGGRVYAAGANVDLKHEQPAVLDALAQLSAATGLRFQITSGYRSTAKQQYLYDNADKLGLIRGVTVAKPGTSLHEKGAAADVMAIVNGKAVPITQAVTAAQLAQFGLTGIGPRDAVHVQLASAGALKLPATDTTTSLFGSLAPFTKNVPATPAVLTGDKLLPAALRDRISRFANQAKNAQGQVALSFLRDELAALHTAKDQLQTKLKTAKGEQAAAIRSEITDIEGRTRDVNTAIKQNLADQAEAVRQAIAAVKSRYATLISPLREQVGSMYSRIQQDLDEALQARFQQQVADLGKRFYQGAMTPLEQQLADAQKADRAAQLQQDLSDAIKSGDDARIKAARHAIEMDDLAARAAQERADADRDYADQLAQLQQRQRLEQEKLDDSLAAFGQRLQDGSASIDDLNQILAPFGLSLADIPTEQLAYDMGNLTNATHELARVMLEEAAELAALGDQADAQRLRDQAGALGVNPPPGTVATSSDFIASGGSRYVAPGTVAALASLGERITHQLPRFGDGGFAPQPMLGIIGDSPGGEYFFPKGMGDALMQAAAGGRGSGGDVVLQVGEREIGRVIVDALNGDASLLADAGRVLKPAIEKA